VSENTNKRGLVIFNVVMAFGMLIVFSGIAWMGARRPVAAIYGLARDVETLTLWRYISQSQQFSLDNLRAGYTPPFSAIYSSSVYFGLFAAMLIAILALVSILRLDAHDVRKYVRTPGSIPYADIMGKMALTHPSVRFFQIFDMMELPTDRGDARLPMRSLELLRDADAIVRLLEFPGQGRRPELEVDRGKLTKWYVDRFGPSNPFIDLPDDNLYDAERITDAVDRLDWHSLLIAYGAASRIHAFYTDSEKAFEIRMLETDQYFDSIWTSINEISLAYGKNVRLGFVDDDHRVQVAEIILSDIEPVKKRAGPKPRLPLDQIYSLREVLDEEGPHFAIVEEARQKFKALLLRHRTTETGQIPVREDPKTGEVIYAPKFASSGEESFARTHKAKLDKAASVLQSILFRHHYTSGFIGALLDEARKGGVLPPLVFRWVRFYDMPLWMFLQNHGMPTAYPENAAAFEHFQTEKRTSSTLKTPFIRSAIEGLLSDVYRQLTDDVIATLREEYEVKQVKSVGAPRARSGAKQLRSMLSDLSRKGPVVDVAEVDETPQPSAKQSRPRKPLFQIDG